MIFKHDIRAILFDLDGTLLPMRQEYFLRTYFGLLSEYVTPFGIDPKAFLNAMKVGIKVMLTNDGSVDNKEAFWNGFLSVFEGDKANILPLTDKFYYNDFKRMRQITAPNEAAKAAIEAARRKGRRVVLATNPCFPMSAQLERMSWICLSENDFDLVTSYENSSFCKPNPKYYLEICEKIGVAPEECLMIGNDESDDMKGASEAGMSCYLVTNNRITCDHYIWTGERGSFDQMCSLLERI